MNYEMMWKELKERMPTLIDENGLVILSDIEELIEELEMEWVQLIKFKKGSVTVKDNYHDMEID